MTVEISPPLPDELLFSTLARARYRLGFSRRAFSELVFGDKNYSVRPNSHSWLGWIANKLSESSAWKQSAEELRDSHTMLSFIAPFLTAQQREEFQIVTSSHERCTQTRFPHLRKAYKTLLPEMLRYCEACLQDDLDWYGEATWRRAHQIPELRFCTIHRTPLKATKISSRSPDFLPLTDANTSGSAFLTDPLDRFQFELVEQVKELQGQPYFHPGWQLFRNALVYRLQKRVPSVTIRAIERALFEKYEATSAEAVLSADGGTGKWLRSFLDRNDHPLAPGQLAVICASIGCRVGDVLKSARSGRQVYRSWWPCLASTSACANRRTIHHYTPEADGRSARFVCPECQTSYVRPLPLLEYWDGSFIHCLELPNAGGNHRTLVA